jgi:hypothetical protein
MTSRPWAWLAPVLTAACASTPAKNAEEKDVAVVRHVDKMTGGAASVALAGARCQGRKTCSCRVAPDEPETEPPPEGKKRIEIRMAADGGSATLQGGLGHFQAYGPQESCFYVDVPAGTTAADVAFVATADKPFDGVAPRFQLFEYGPKGPYWYAIIDVECKGQQGRCDRQGVEAWAARNLEKRKRGRLDPCGSTVVHKLAWEKAGGMDERDGGMFRELTVRFALEVKKFATQFAPGSTECVPK